MVSLTEPGARWLSRSQLASPCTPLSPALGLSPTPQCWALTRMLATQLRPPCLSSYNSACLLFSLPQPLTLRPAFLQVHVSMAIEAANMGMIQKKNSEDFFMMVLPETRGTHRMPVDSVWGVSVLKCGPCSPEQRLKWTLSMALEAVGTSSLPLTHHSAITADAFPAWLAMMTANFSGLHSLTTIQKLGPCPQRNRWPRGSPSTNIDNKKYPRAPDYSNSTSSAVDRLHGWDLLLLFRLDTHIFMRPLYFIAGKNNQRRANDIPYLVFRGTKVGWSPCLEEPGKVLQIHSKMDPLLFNTEQPPTEH